MTTMLPALKSKPHRPKSKRSPAILFLLILAWSIAAAWVLAMATHAQPANTIDAVPQRYQLGQELYLENCATCHIAVPPAVLPVQTWQRLLQDTQHYGVQIKPLVDPPRILVWNYLRFASRPLNQDEEIPYRIANSRYFKALHPKVKLPKPTQLSSCVTCHPNANAFNFRSLTSEWENSP
ncbi:MAG: hypothetical protein CLLPBCKN_008159 [Chroococcidiopsis cubana SAG 39.79]|jgi:hypothetical protein|uniref:Dihem cytochrome c n=3 Tax=Chroococcidiopsidaceae TaxID=1890528 RepID=K9U5H9_CHRTP|nr:MULTISPECIES: diheme cytochrome C [Chroococcidiopsis]AFY89509.1 Dihem cytochrome c [Chroococcidiopsis thermalis PCC 7203]MDZ4878722.1 hypothetical protein [Chroococcidiopsis cubana SAG 39.79]RUT09248.1 cytochrome c [Chroococcidiopsis cubana SAG 39.79]